MDVQQGSEQFIKFDIKNFTALIGAPFGHVIYTSQVMSDKVRSAPIDVPETKATLPRAMSFSTPPTFSTPPIPRTSSWGFLEGLSKRKCSLTIAMSTTEPMAEEPEEPRSRSMSIGSDSDTTPNLSVDSTTGERSRAFSIGSIDLSKSTSFGGYMAKLLRPHNKDVLDGRDMNILSPTSL